MVDRHLYTFIQVADCGSFLKASEKMYISSNAVTKQMNLLENDLGVKLFIRSPRGLKLTPAGELVYKEAKKMIRQSEDVLAKARELEHPETLSIRVGVSMMNPATILMEMWDHIAQKHPNIRLEIVPYQDSVPSFSDVLANLGKTIDLVACIYQTSYWGDQYRSLFLRDLPICVACSRSHPLAAKKRLQIEDLYDQTFYLRRRGLSDSVDLLRDELENYPRIRLKDLDIIDYNTFNRLASSQDLIFSYECWNNVHPLLLTLPVDWAFTSPYGLIYAKDPSKELLEFLMAVGTV